MLPVRKHSGGTPTNAPRSLPRGGLTTPSMAAVRLSHVAASEPDEPERAEARGHGGQPDRGKTRGPARELGRVGERGHIDQRGREVDDRPELPKRQA